MDYTFEQIKGDKNLSDIIAIREKVFINEDHYPKEAITSSFDKTSTHFIAKKENRIIGVITVVTGTENLPIEKFVDLKKFKDKPMAEIQKLAVLPEERKGFVSLGLMVLAYEYAKEHGAKRIVIFSLERKSENIELYKKFGFNTLLKFDFYDVGKACAMALDIDNNSSYEKDQKNVRRANLIKKLVKILKI